MNVNNFLSFAVLCSCFLAAFFSILKFNHIIDIILSFLMLSFCISIILKFGISLVVRFTKITRGNHFSTDYDDHLEEVRLEVNKLEKFSQNKIHKIHNLEIHKLLEKKK